VIGQNYYGPQYERRRRLESCADHVLHCEQKFFLVAIGSTSIDIVTGETPNLRVTLLQQSNCTGNTNFTKLLANESKQETDKLGEEPHVGDMPVQTLAAMLHSDRLTKILPERI